MSFYSTLDLKTYAISEKQTIYNFASMDDLWFKIYPLIKDQQWFNEIKLNYWGKRSTNKSLISHLLEEEEFTEEDITEPWLSHKSTNPSKCGYWIFPHNCGQVNGYFLYQILIHLGFDVTVVRSEDHCYLLDKNNIIYDLLWEPFDIHCSNLSCY